MTEFVHITPPIVEEPASIGTALYVPLGESAAVSIFPVAMTAAMSEPPRRKREVKPADGTYKPAFPIPAREDTEDANEVFEHYKTAKEDPRHVNAHPALTEVDNAEDQPPLICEAVGAMAAAMTTSGSEEGAEAPDHRTDAQKFFDFKPEPEEDRNAKPAMADVPAREDQQRQQGKGSRPPRQEIRIGEKATRLKGHLLAALGSIGVGPTLAY